ncbi:MAG: DUF4123 domain-containing protein [Pseudomonadota bacterium]
MSINQTPLPTVFGLRKPLRDGRLFALLDATSFAGLAQALAGSGMDHASLFRGDDAVLLEHEAPYICALDGTQPRAVRDLIASALYRHAGFLIESDEDIDTLRRHYKNWLTVRLEETQEMVLFRFYDARILLAFVGTLSTTEAAAFIGPSTQLVALSETGQATALSLPGQQPGIPSARFLKGSPYLITTQQSDAFTEVTDTVFRKRAKAYLRTVFPDQAADLPEEDMDELVAGAVADCDRLGVCREADVISMAIARLLRPDLVASDAYWDAVVDQRPNPNQRAGAFIAEIAHGMTPEERETFFARVNFWWDFGKEKP